MTNPFTKFLRQWSRDPDLDAFVSYWDALELVVVQVYRNKMTPVQARAEFERVWPWLRRFYRVWEPHLRPYWQQTRAAGRPVQADPFQLLLNLEQAEDICDNWRAMQHLPAAREALNMLLIDNSPE